jgi:hypothetical protein
MELNANVNVRIENLDQILAALSTLVTVAPASPAVPTEDKSVRRGRPRKAVEKSVRRGRPRKAVEKAEEPKAEEPKAEEPKAEPAVEEPKAEEPKAEEPKAEEPKAEEPKAEEPKDLLPALRAQCMALSRVAGADRVLQVIKSFGFKGLTAVPVEKHAELLQILVDEIKAAEGK